MVPARAEGDAAMTPDHERTEIARMQRMNRIGARTLVCAAIILVVVIVVQIIAR